MITHFVLRPEIVIYLREPASQPDLGSLKHKIYVVLIWEIVFMSYSVYIVK